VTKYPVKMLLFLAPALTALPFWAGAVQRVKELPTGAYDQEPVLKEARHSHATMLAAALRGSAGVSLAAARASCPREVALAVRERDAAATAGGTPALPVLMPSLTPASPPPNSHLYVVRPGNDSLAFNGGRAFEDLNRLVAFGPRPPGSKALAETRTWIVGQLKLAGCQVEEDRFVASTPVGEIPMTNVIARIPGERSSIVMVAGHYDTLRVAGFTFVGANDGGSSAAFLLELARVLGRRRNPVTYWLVFFDGEEALQNWSATDSCYGSRHLEQKLASAGELGRVQAMILVDLIADAKLDIYRDSNSTGWLNDIIFANARRLGYSRYFIDSPPGAIEDDHIPFVNAGVASADIIDLDYGPRNSYWHTAQDTVDKCSALSLAIVGRVVTATLEELERSPRIK
jgi:glutaminyl-peptide cyclotransferase